MTTGIIYQRLHRGNRAYHTKISRVTDDEIVEDAKRYAVRTDWKRGSNRNYQEVHTRRPHLRRLCTEHMDRICGPYTSQGYQVYVYEFSDRSMYVGLTCNPKRRHRGHRKSGPVSNKIKTGTNFLVKIVATGLSPHQAADLEDKETLRYISEGWVNLSLANTRGALGSIRRHTYKRVLMAAHSFKCKKEFYTAFPGEYQAAVKYHWMEKISAELGWQGHFCHRWTEETCATNASLYSWLIDWMTANPGAYKAAQTNGWLDVIKTKHFTRTKSRTELRWTPETCLVRARQFGSVSRWQYECKDGSYQTARRKGWINEIRGTCWSRVLTAS